MQHVGIFYDYYMTAQRHQVRDSLLSNVSSPDYGGRVNKPEPY